MKKYGTVLSCKLTENRYGYVQYKTPEDAEKAIKELNGKEHWGQALQLEVFKSSKVRESTYGVIVTGFKPSLSDDSIKTILEANLKEIKKSFDLNFE